MSATSSTTPAPEGLVAQSDALASGALTASALVDTVLERIAGTQGTLNAFRVVLADEARAEAAEADRKLAAGERLPLLGVPVAIKDDTDYAGQTTPFGCDGPFRPATEDARIVQRLRGAGAIIVGKTNAPEVGQWPISDSKAFGIVRNPYNVDHTPGGSSGGSASAVAAGLVAGAVGSDGGGSVRIPAAWTNLVGIKPGRGRISAYPVLDYGNGISTHGPLARTVADAAALYDVLAGDLHADERYQSAPLPEPLSASVGRDPGPLRIAVCMNAPFIATSHRPDSALMRAVRGVADSLAALGHDVHEYELQYGPVGATWIVRGSTFCRGWVDDNVPDIKLLDPRTRASVRAGGLMRPLLGRAVAAESGLARRAGKVFEQFDVVLMPTTAQPPLRAGSIDGLGEMATNTMISRACPYTFAWNVLGWPGVNVPAGFVGDNLPVGVQLLGQTGDEPLLVSLAAQLEERERWFEQRPDPAHYGLSA